MEIERSHDSASVKQTRVFSILRNRDRDAVYRHWEISLAFIVHAPLDIRTLERAFRQTMQSFVEARSTFRIVDGALRVETLPASQFELSGAPMRRHSRPEALEAARSDAWRGFRSFQEPLAALRVYPHDDGTTLVALQISHLLTDGAAVEMLINRVMLTYLAGAETFPAPASEFTFADYVDWEDRFLASEAGEIQQLFWLAREHAARAIVPLPYDTGAGETLVGEGGVLRIEVSSTQMEHMAARARCRSYEGCSSGFRV